MFSDRTGWNLQPNRFSRALARQRSSGRRLHDLTASNPTGVGLRYDQTKILRALSSPAALAYDPQPKGLLSAREAVSAYYRSRSGASAELPAPDPEQIILTASTSEAYTYVFRLLCNRGDEVLVPRPSYPLFQFLADLQDVRLVAFDLVYDHGWEVDFHSLERCLSPRSRAVILVSPNNPTGSYVHPQEARRLNEICLQRGIALIGDEVFLDYAVDGELRASLALNEGALTFTLSGLSKISGLPQMKLAWLIVSGGSDERQKEALARLEVIADTYLSHNTPTQLAAPALLETRHEFQRQLRGRLCANLAELDRQLAAGGACSRLLIEGGWYAILRVPSTQPDEELAIRMLEERQVLVHPGHFYDFHSEGYLVVSLIPPEEEFACGTRELLGFIADAS
ncbi:MAG TPA: pyridoxal phosphate-dependent aminotransferase [Terriglobales bacterium]|nr:pyridoxal phosphate-dependent aminotransferase [Terriglobales bacterium]